MSYCLALKGAGVGASFLCLVKETWKMFRYWSVLSGTKLHTKKRITKMKNHNLYNFEDIKRKALLGRSRVGYNGQSCGIYHNTRAVYYPEPERVAIRFYDTDVLTIYPNGEQEIDARISTTSTRKRINSYMSGGEVFNYKGDPYFWSKGSERSKGYSLDRGRLRIRNNGDCWLPIDHETRVNVVWYTWGRLPLGKRWYINPASYLIHRCGRKMHGTKYATLICSACGENANDTFPNITEKIQALRDFATLKDNVGAE
jgi:hypothetical protein